MLQNILINEISENLCEHIRQKQATYNSYKSKSFPKGAHSSPNKETFTGFICYIHRKMYTNIQHGV